MIKATITLSYDEEKLSALKLYLGQKEQSLEAELTAAVENLYLRTVPANVRDFIDLRGRKNGRKEKEAEADLCCRSSAGTRR